MNKVFITGGAGFIGSHITESLLDYGFEVTVYDNFSSGTLDNLKHLNSKNLNIISGDILDYDLLAKSMRNHDYVSHHAAQLEIFLALDDPALDLEVNTKGTLNVLKAAKENQIKKVINVSSACVYGQTDGALGELDETTPNWDYGVSKLAAEKYAKIYNDYKGLPVVSLRYGIVYGEREWYRRVLPIFMKRIIEGQAPVVFGNGNQIRDFVYVGDVAKFHLLCLLDRRADGNVYNVGSGERTSIKELAQKIIEIQNKPLTIIYENTAEGEFSSIIQGKKRNTAELQNMILDISKAKQLGWNPEHDLKDGLIKQFNWAKENLQRWDKIYTTQW